MEEQLPTPLDNLDNNQANDQQNLVVQTNQEMPKEVKKITCYYSFVIVIFSLKMLYYFFLLFIIMIAAGVNYNYEKHYYRVDNKYYSQFFIFIFPNSILSAIIMSVGLPHVYHKYKKKVIIINIFMITIKIPVCIFFCISLVKICQVDSGFFISYTSIGLEIIYISLVVIFEKIKIKYIK